MQRYAGKLPRVARLCLKFGAVTLLASIGTGAIADDTAVFANARHAFDISTRITANEESSWHLLAIGLDLHTVVTSDSGDIGTLTFQPYLLRADDLPAPGGLFDDRHDWALQWRIVNFNYTGIGHGRFNVRVGHFEVPFGLEQVEQTNGTLYQLNSPRSIGMKADWGASINGVLPHAEYEIAALTGTGNDIVDANVGILAGRIGTRSDRRVSVGLSFLNGEQREPGIVDRERYGIDVRYALGNGIDLAWEFAQGSDDGRDVEHQFAQLRWNSLAEAWTAYLQLRESRLSGSEKRTDATIGLRLEPNPRWSLSAQFNTDVRTGSAQPGPDTFTAQFRYRLQ